MTSRFTSTVFATGFTAGALGALWGWHAIAAGIICATVGIAVEHWRIERHKKPST